MTKGEKRVISVSVFHSRVVCNMNKNLLYVWLVKLILVIWFLSMVWIIILVYLSMSYVYEMKCMVVPLYPCYIDVIMCIFTICHTILSHDYTHHF
jgi:hypothetical protein